MRAVSFGAVSYTHLDIGGIVDKKYFRRALFGQIFSSDDEPVDEGILVLYKGPASFTGEDMAEISCHGGTAVTEEVLLSCVCLLYTSP